MRTRIVGTDNEKEISTLVKVDTPSLPVLSLSKGWPRCLRHSNQPSALSALEGAVERVEGEAISVSVILSAPSSVAPKGRRVEAKNLSDLPPAFPGSTGEIRFTACPERSRRKIRNTGHGSQATNPGLPAPKTVLRCSLKT
jgi:hypothetical protein